jgi:uncharacterized protein
MFDWLRKITGFGTSAQEVVNLPGGDYSAPAQHEEDAVKWFRKAAEKGTGWGQYNLGLRCASGQGVPQDAAEAFKWFSRAAAQGHAMAEYHLGTMYEEGLGTPPDPVEAYKWFHLAALQGVREAQAGQDRLQRSLSTEQVAEANRRASGLAPQNVVRFRSKDTNG